MESAGLVLVPAQSTEPAVANAGLKHADLVTLLITLVSASRLCALSSNAIPLEVHAVQMNARRTVFWDEMADATGRSRHAKAKLTAQRLSAVDERP